MAKIAFSKFGLKPNSEVKTINWGGQDIEVIQYLPIQKKLGLIGRVISQAHEQDANYSNPVKIEVYTALETIFEYTNITFTEKQKEDIQELTSMFRDLMGGNEPEDGEQEYIRDFRNHFEAQPNCTKVADSLSPFSFQPALL